MAFKILETMTSEPMSPSAVEHMVETRDGVHLATDVYLPNSPTTHSAILVRTPYDKASRYTGLSREAEYFRARGFVFVTQDVRGKFRSTGDTVPYAFDVADGYDTVEWITQQPWSNGNVGVAGASYYGFTTWATVASGHPAIKAAIPQVTGIEIGCGHVAGRYLNEMPSLISLNDLLQIWTNNDGYLAEIDWASDSVNNIFADWREQIGECIGATQKMRRGQTEEWYNPYGERHPYFTTTIPILHWQNWYDPGLAPLGLQDWRHFRSLGGLRDLHYLRVGSADHGGFKLEDVDQGDARNPYLNDDALAEKIETECGEMADFFDEFLNGNKPSIARARARWHVGHVGWQETAEYPPPSQPLVFHLSARGDQVHSLHLDADTSETVLMWTHDPQNPVPSTTDIEAFWYLLAAYPDERALADRVDVLTFRTEPLDGDLDFAGRPELMAEIQFSGPSAHLFAKLQDVHPDGTTRPISWGRAVVTETSGGAVRLNMDDNAYRLRRGHQLQLQIQSSDFPYFVVHPGTGENPWTATQKQTTEQSIVVGGLAGAQLVIPTVRLE
jgi:predicted acyl esterase